MKRLLTCVLLFAVPLVACGGEELPLPETEEALQTPPASDGTAVTEGNEVHAAAGCWVTLRSCSVSTSGGVRIPDCSSTNCTWQQHITYCSGLWNDICS